MPAKTLDLPFGQDDPLGDAGAWVLSETIFDGNGVVEGTGGNFIINGDDHCRTVSGPRGQAALRPAPENVDECLSALGYHTVFKYHPADRFWTFQLIETGLLLGLACVAITVAALALRRRTA